MASAQSSRRHDHIKKHRMLFVLAGKELLSIIQSDTQYLGKKKKKFLESDIQMEIPLNRDLSAERVDPGCLLILYLHLTTHYHQPLAMRCFYRGC